MLEQYDEPIVLEPAHAARAAVIWLHGLGADGNDFLPIVHELRLPDTLGVRFIFPHAQVQPVSINNGYPMRAWYDIKQMDLQREVDLEGVAQSSAYLHSLITTQQRAGIDMEKIVLAGFSQGGVVALDCALQLDEKPAGVLALSTYLAKAQGTAAGLAIFQAHGTQDPVVPLSAGKQAFNALIALGAQVNWHDYPMPHSVHPAEIVDIANWLRERLA